MKMTVFWDVAPCCLVEIDRCFSGAYCLGHQGDYKTPMKRRSVSARLRSSTSKKRVDSIHSYILARKLKLNSINNFNMFRKYEINLNTAL
jgi:hypothetical protein